MGRIRVFLAPTVAAVALLSMGMTSGAEATWPARVLVTNDNGIDDPGLIELARALARVAETHVVAPATDQSGMSNLLTATREGRFRVEPRDIGDGIDAYAVHGTPADCVVFALAGPLRGRLPDLVISGINGGPNLGDDWFGSGTIGAARSAAYFGFPAIAVSGLDDDDPDAVRAVVDWVVALAQSEAARALKAPQYLTVSVPVVHPSQIEGVDVVTRARGLVSGSVAVDSTASGDARWQTWRLALAFDPAKAPKRSDVDAAARNMIAVVPMRVDESDPALAETLRARADFIPDWVQPPKAMSECPSGLGVMIDDAEDSSGREWGVIIEKILPGGRAADIGLRVGDVIVALNATSLEPPRGSPVDPVDIMTRILRKLSCGDTVALDFVRNDERHRVEFAIPKARQR